MLRIEIDTGNAAFEQAGGDELARILRGLAMNFEDGTLRPCQGRLRDSNGNTCGSYQLDAESASSETPVGYYTVKRWSGRYASYAVIAVYQGGKQEDVATELVLGEAHRLARELNSELEEAQR